MYPLIDKIAPVKEIQKYLHFINDRAGYLKRVAIDGIYADETFDAVREFQVTNAILPTGLVNYETFERLKNEYATLMLNDMRFVPRAERFPIGIGMQGNDVLYIHAMMCELKKTYEWIEYVGNSTYFSHTSEKATKQLREFFGMPESPDVNFSLYTRMQKELDAIQILNQNYADGALF